MTSTSEPVPAIAPSRHPASSKVVGRILHHGHRYRLAICGHKAAEIGAACLGLMVQGHLADVTVAHFLIASKTGLLAVLPAIGVTFSRHVRLLTNRWSSAVFLGLCGFFADAVIHESHYPGAYTEAALTAVGGAILSVFVSYTPVGRRLDRLGEELEKRKTETGKLTADGCII